MDIFKDLPNTWSVSIYLENSRDYMELNRNYKYHLCPWGVSSLKLALQLANDRLKTTIRGKNLKPYGKTGKILVFQKAYIKGPLLTVLFSSNKQIELAES